MRTRLLWLALCLLALGLWLSLAGCRRRADFYVRADDGELIHVARIMADLGTKATRKDGETEMSIEADPAWKWPDIVTP